MKHIIPLCQVLLIIISIVVRIECQEDEYDDYDLYDEADVKVLCEKYSYFGNYSSPRDITHYLHCDEDEYSEVICPEEKPIFENGRCVPGYNLKEFCKNKPEGLNSSPRGINYYINCNKDSEQSSEGRCPADKPIFYEGDCDESYDLEEFCENEAEGLYPSQRGINYFFCCDKENLHEGICPEDKPIFAADTCTELPITLPTTIATTSRERKTTQKIQSTKTTLVFKTTKPTTTKPTTTKPSTTKPTTTKPTTTKPTTTKPTTTKPTTSKPTTTETITTITKETEEYCPSIDDPSEIIFKPNKLNCSEYFLCYHGIPKTISCGKSLYFNPKTNSCDLPKNVICEADDVQHTIPKCKSQNGFEYFNHPDKCYFFYICRYGKISLQRCPFMHSFDLESKRCIRAHLSKCIDK